METKTNISNLDRKMESMDKHRLNLIKKKILMDHENEKMRTLLRNPLYRTSQRSKEIRIATGRNPKLNVIDKSFDHVYNKN